MTPQQLEAKLSHLMTVHITAKNPTTRLSAWEAFKNLHAQRTPETVRLMEVERGLCG